MTTLTTSQVGEQQELFTTESQDETHWLCLFSPSDAICINLRGEIYCCGWFSKEARRILKLMARERSEHTKCDFTNLPHPPDLGCQSAAKYGTRACRIYKPSSCKYAADACIFNRRCLSWQLASETYGPTNRPIQWPLTNWVKHKTNATLVAWPCMHHCQQVI